MRNIDSTSPIPLFHQIAESIRYQIATGEIKAGDQLEPVRKAAEMLGVNMHTVRHAYRSLAEQGLVQSRGARGTVVVETDVVSDIPLKREPHPGRTVAVVECSQTQATDLAQQLEEQFDIAARPFSLESSGEPEGDVVATFFHYNDLRRRWPHRMATIAFVGIRPEPGIEAQIRSRFGVIKRAFVCETELPMAANIAADLSGIVPTVEFVPMISDGAFFEADDEVPRLLAPRVWGRLPPALRGDFRAVHVRYSFDQNGLGSIGQRLGWATRKMISPINEPTIKTTYRVSS